MNNVRHSRVSLHLVSALCCSGAFGRSTSIAAHRNEAKILCLIVVYFANTGLAGTGWSINARTFLDPPENMQRRIELPYIQVKASAGIHERHQFIKE